MTDLDLSVDGMHCDHCVRAVRQALERLDGVVVRDVRMGSVAVTYDPARVQVDALLDAVADEGYVASRVA